MTKLLTLKHWQLFCLLFGLPFIFQFVYAGTIVVNQGAAVYFWIFPIIMILFISLFFGWLYALSTNLHKKLPATVPMNLSLFKTFLIIPAVYLLAISIGMLSMFSTITPDNPPNPVIIVMILPVHLFSMFCIFYCFYFNAKALRAVELQRPVTFSDFSGEFFLIWFYPVGIWLLQPRINKLFDPATQA